MVIDKDKIPSVLMPVNTLSNPQDVATLLESYEHALSEYHPDEITGIMQYEGYYFVIVDVYNGGSSFDFFSFVNSIYKGFEEINCLNAKLLFPRMLSRGMYQGSLENMESENSDFSEDSPTGFLAETELNSNSSKSGKIYYEKSRIFLEIPESGLVIGRSAKRADFRILDNTDVSRAHCRLSRKGLDIYICDLTSLNGTYVNGYRLSPGEDVHVVVGDTISVAGEIFKVK